jgi:hypothetical protein
VHYAVGVSRKKQAPDDAAISSCRADNELAAQFSSLLADAREAEEEFRGAQASQASELELRQLGKDLDAKLTAVMRAAFAGQRAAIGPRGYSDRIYRRQAMATSRVHAWTTAAQRLLTMRESHRITGIARLPRTPAAVTPEARHFAVH